MADGSGLNPPDAVWRWLVPVGSGKARFTPTTRVRILDNWHGTDALLSLVLMELGDFPVMLKMLRTPSQRAEAEPRAKASGGAA